MGKFKHLDPQTVELAGIAASIAGGCRTCLDYHYKKGIETSCTIDQVAKARGLDHIQPVIITF